MNEEKSQADEEQINEYDPLDNQRGEVQAPGEEPSRWFGGRRVEDAELPELNSSDDSAAEDDIPVVDNG